MKILGMHWALHLLYITILVLGLFGWKTLHTQADFLQTEIGQVQNLSIPEIQRSNEEVFADISRTCRGTPIPRNQARYQTTQKALRLVDSFTKQYGLAQNILKIGIPTAGPDNPVNALVLDYDRLGDSLRVAFALDTTMKPWLEQWFATGVDDCRLLEAIARDSSAGRLLMQNLELKAQLALNRGLARLQDQMEEWEIGLDAFLPAIAYDDCPQVGQPFQAAVFLAAYSTGTDNVQAKINGHLVPMRNGVAHFKAVVAKSGKVEFQVKNPLTEEVRTYTKEFTF